MPKRKTISKRMRSSVILKSNLCCAICHKKGKSDTKFGLPVVIETEPQKRWLNEYDGTFLYEHLFMEFDHIIPLEKGGETTEENLQVLCRQCNREKGNQTPDLIQTLSGSAPPQSKRESKVKVKVKEKNKYRDFVFLTPDEHKKLLTTYGENSTDKLIADLNRYIGQSGKEYKSHYFALLNFAQRDDMPKLVVPKEDIATEQRGLERKRQEVREMYGNYLQERTIKELQSLRKEKKELTRWWLIDEILKKKGGR